MQFQPQRCPKLKSLSNLVQISPASTMQHLGYPQKFLPAHMTLQINCLQLHIQYIVNFSDHVEHFCSFPPHKVIKVSVPSFNVKCTDAFSQILSKLTPTRYGILAMYREILILGELPCSELHGSLWSTPNFFIPIKELSQTYKFLHDYTQERLLKSCIYSKTFCS